MYFKLALRNVRKSYKDFLIYFLTLAFSVCLFYMFNSFQDQQAVMQINTSQKALIQLLATIMTYLSIFIAIVLAFLILYANNFLIRRRKKELGIYMLLGMPKNKISKVLVYETLIIGVLSLLMGMLGGLILSQVLTTVTAGMFEVILDYQFVFSPSATLLTIISFSIIFLIVMLFNSVVLNRYKLIDLLRAEHIMEKMRIKKLGISLILFLISLVMLGIVYHKAITLGAMAINHLPFIIVCGSIGTLLFFMSLAGFLLTSIKGSRTIYLKNLNCFILKQINSNINTNFISMSIVCIMLLLSIGALSTGWNMNTTINKGIRNVTPYDYSLSQTYVTSKGAKKSTFDIQKDVTRFQFDKDPAIKSSGFTTMYTVPLQSDINELSSHIKKQDMKELMDMNMNIPMSVVSLSDYNAVLRMIGYETIHLEDDETYLYTTMAVFDDAIKEIINDHPTVRLLDHNFRVINNTYASPNLYTSPDIGYDLMIFVVKDDLIPADTPIHLRSWNVNFKDPENTQLAKYVDKTLHTHYGRKFPYSAASAQEVKVNNKGVSVIFTYIGLYLGIVFMIASAIILALQQLSQANDNKKHYAVLSKIGTDQKMMDRSILLQIGIYFMMPLLLAIVHSIVGIQVVNNLVMLFGKTDIFVSSLFTAGIIVLIYGSYFAITYIGYKNILKS